MAVGASPAAPGRIARIRGLLRREDLLLVAWALVGLPLLGLLVGGAATSAEAGATPFGASSLRGLVYLVGALSALAALGTRTAVDPVRGTPPGALVSVRSKPAAAEPSLIAGHTAILGPLFGGVLFLTAEGLNSLGVSDAPVPLICIAVVVALGLQASGRAPVVQPVVRRLLVAPFILAGTIMFSDVIGGMDLGPSILGGVVSTASAATQGGTAGDTMSFGLFVFGLITGGAAVFYTMLVAAPRILVEREGSTLAWVARFAAWYGGTLAGFGWIAALGR